MPASASDPTSAIEVVDRFFAALEAGDVEAMDALYAPELVVWTNLTKIDAERAPSLRLVQWLARTVQGLRYEIVARHEIPGGVVQQHVLTGRAPDGTALSAPACLVVLVRDGLITRIDEYLNGDDVAALMRPAS
jgi:ketosteroid isomerase-like protein